MTVYVDELRRWPRRIMSPPVSRARPSRLSVMPRSFFRRPPPRRTAPACRVPPPSTSLGAPEREVLEQLRALGTGYHELGWSTALRDLIYAGLVEEWWVPEPPRAAPWRRSDAPRAAAPRSYRLTERGREALRPC